MRPKDGPECWQEARKRVLGRVRSAGGREAIEYSQNLSLDNKMYFNRSWFLYTQKRKILMVIVKGSEKSKRAEAAQSQVLENSGQLI